MAIFYQEYERLTDWRRVADTLCAGDYVWTVPIYDSTKTSDVDVPCGVYVLSVDRASGLVNLMTGGGTRLTVDLHKGCMVGRGVAFCVCSAEFATRVSFQVDKYYGR